MKYLFFIVFLSIFLFACTSNKQDSSQVTAVKIYEFEINDGFIRPIKSETAVVYHDSTFCLFFQNIKTKELVRCNFYEKNAGIHYDKKIKIKNHYCSLFFSSTDSIFSFINKTNQIFLKNSSGETLKTYQISEKYVPLSTPLIKLTGSNSRLLLGNSNKKLNFGKLEQRKVFYENVKPLLIVDIVDSIPTCMAFGDFPEKYIVSGDNFYDPNPSACFGNDGLICVSFGADDYLYLYNDSTMVLKKKVKSEFINRFNPYPDSKTFDMLYYKNYTLEEPKYTDIIFDPWNNLYYRVVRHRFEEEKNIMENTWSVIVLDEKLNILYEKLFDYHYSPNVFVSTPFGILMLNIGRSINNNSVFEMFKFKKYE